MEGLLWNDNDGWREVLRPGAELKEIERNSLVRSVSWELDGETINTTERNIYTHDDS